jgi:RNA polymerase sigma-70 factor (ECF subfamily)
MGKDTVVYKPSNRELVQQHSATVFRVAYAACKSRAGAEDIMQEVFLRLVRSQPELTSEEHAKAWLLRVTMNHCASQLREVWNTRVDSLDEMQERIGDRAVEWEVECFHSGNGDPVTTSVEANEQRESVLAAVMKLPPKQRACVHLHYFEDQSIAQIAGLTDWPSSTIKSHLRRGREALRSTLSKEYDYAD